MRGIARTATLAVTIAALAGLACRAPQESPSPAAAPPVEAAPSAPSTPLPDSRDAERLEPRVRDEIAAAILAARPLLERAPGSLSHAELEVAALACVLEHAHQLMDDAADCYARLERIAPEDARWPYLLGHARLGRSDRDAAHAAFERALEDAPRNGPILAWLGQVLYDLQRFDEARSRLLAALEVDGDNAFALFRLGQLELQQERAAAGVAHLERALALQPEASAVHHALAQALRELGRDAEAETHARQAGQVRPGMRDPWLNAIKASASGERVHVDRGGRAFKRGDLETAEAEFRLALEEDQGSADAWMNLGAVLARRGDHPGARVALNRALALAPQDPDVHFNLGVVAAAEGLTSEAISHQRDALRLDERHPGANFNLANALLRLGKVEEAATRFAAVVEADPANVDARLAGAMSLVELGRDRQARASLEQGILATPDHPRLNAVLARLLSTSRDASVRDGARALGLAQASVQAEATLEAVESLAMACAEIGQFDEAIKWQQVALDGARRANRPELMARIDGTLALYRNGQPLRLP